VRAWRRVGREVTREGNEDLVQKISKKLEREGKITAWQRPVPFIVASQEDGG
jgi:hypothetical protein